LSAIITPLYFFDRIDRMNRIFFAFPEERQKASALYEGTYAVKL